MLKGGDSKQAKRSAFTEEELMRQANQSFQQRATSIDGDTVAELDRIRQRVVARAERSRFPWFMQPVFGGALAACLVVAVAVFNLYPGMDAVPEEASELEMVLVNSDFEMFTEDLEFYQWLEEIDEA